MRLFVMFTLHCYKLFRINQIHNHVHTYGLPLPYTLYSSTTSLLGADVLNSVFFLHNSVYIDGIASRKLLNPLYCEFGHTIAR